MTIWYLCFFSISGFIFYLDIQWDIWYYFHSSFGMQFSFILTETKITRIFWPTFFAFFSNSIKHFLCQIMSKFNCIHWIEMLFFFLKYHPLNRNKFTGRLHQKVSTGITFRLNGPTQIETIQCYSLHCKLTIPTSIGISTQQIRFFCFFAIRMKHPNSSYCI